MKATYTIDLKFSSELSDKEKNQIASNILEALVHEIGTRGIVPDTAEAYTTEVSVKRNASGVTFKKKVN